MPLSPDLHVGLGAILGSSHGHSLPRHYGDPEAEYQDACREVAVVDRSYRSRLGVTGRDPLQMLHGVVSGRMPGPPTTGDDGVRRTRAEYSAVLTPKGKLVSDLRVLRESPSAESDLLLEVPAEGVDGLVTHLRKLLPPRFAALEDRSESSGMLTLVGPQAAAMVSDIVLGGAVSATEVHDLREGDVLQVDRGDGTITVIRTAEVAPAALDVVAGSACWGTIWSECVAEGARPAGQGVWETLRVEAGRPALGIDMGEDTLPFEAGIVDRAIDHAKGCYTGQEVIVRVRDRGRVNRHLRGLRLGDAPVPAAGVEVYAGESMVGAITSAVTSPRFGTLALGYLRREVEPPTEVSLHHPGGAPATAIALESEDWPGSRAE